MKINFKSTNTTPIYLKNNHKNKSNKYQFKTKFQRNYIPIMDIMGESFSEAIMSNKKKS